MSRELDADALGPAELPGQVLLEFGSLAAGESVFVSAGRPLRDVLAALQEQRDGEFEWTVLQDGPDRFRVEVRRRSRSGGLTIRDVLNADHERIDRLAGKVAELLEGPSTAETARRLEELACGVERHFAQEENVLFATIERASSAAPAHLEVLRREHAVIRGLIHGLRESFAQRHPSDAQVASATLRLELRRHARKELWILYPLLDEIAGENRTDLLRAMQTV